MNIDLNGKTAVVTGSTEGIGFGIARQLAAAGANTVINGRQRSKVDAAVARLNELFSDGKVIGAPADVSTCEGCKALLEAVPACDILVNNAGIFQPIDFFDTDDEIW